MKFVIVTVTPDAQVEVKGQGFKGKVCDQKMAPIIKALGTVTERKNLPEYNQPVEQKQST